jgi:hypothetical protein
MAEAATRIVKFTGVTDDTIGREEISEIINGVDFTCFERGKTEGMVILKSGLNAKEVVEKLEANPGNLSVIQGEASIVFKDLKVFSQIKRTIWDVL